MTAQIRTRLRNCILEQLAAASEMGLPANILVNGARYGGVPLEDSTADIIEAECDGYLLHEGFVCKGDGAEIHAANKRWRITAAGRGYAHAQGLA